MKAVKAVAIIVALALVPPSVDAQHELSLEVETLRPAEIPALSLGESEGAEFEFYRVTDALWLSDGRLVVLNSGTREVRVYSAEGDFLGGFGREGEGPGEFTRPTRLFRAPGDSIVVWDEGGVRASVFSPELEFARIIRLEPAPQAPRLVGIAANGTVVVASMDFEGVGGPEIRRIPEDQFVYSLSGQRIDNLGRAPGMAGVVRSAGGGVEVLRPLIAPSTTYGVGGGLLWVETGEEHGVRAIRIATGAVESFSWSGPSLLMTDEHREAIIEDRLRAVDDPAARRRARASYESRPMPSSIPATTRVLADGDGRGWVELASTPGTGSSDTEWLVISPGGEPPIRVALPSRMTLLNAKEANVLVVERDDLGLEFVRQYELVAR